MNDKHPCDSGIDRTPQAIAGFKAMQKANNDRFVCANSHIPEDELPYCSEFIGLDYEVLSSQHFRCKKCKKAFLITRSTKYPKETTRIYAKCVNHPCFNATQMGFGMTVEDAVGGANS